MSGLKSVWAVEKNAVYINWSWLNINTKDIIA